MNRVLLLSLSVLVLAGCGIKRPLMPPKDIPAYEERQRRRIERLDADTPVQPPAAAPVQGQ